MNYFENKICPYGCNADCDECEKIIIERKALKIIKRCPKEVIEEVETYSSFEELYEDWGKMAFIKSKEEFELVRKVLCL